MELQSVLHALIALLLIVFSASMWVTLLESARIRRDARNAHDEKVDADAGTGGVGTGIAGTEDVEKGSHTAPTALSSFLPSAFLPSAFLPGAFLGRRNKAVDYPAVLIEVASRLQAGVPTSDAWHDSWKRTVGRDPGEVGVDGVPQSLRDQPGVVARMVVAATRFSAITGAPLKDVLRRTAQSLTEMERANDAQETAFAGPKLSAKVLTFLPIAGIFGASVLGVEPLAWFLSGGIPVLLGLLGVGLTVAGHLVTKGMIDRAARVSEEQVVAPVYCDLVVSGMKGGASVPTVLRALGSAAEDPAYKRVGTELMLGAPWVEAWTPLPSAGSLLERGLQPAWEDGVSSTGILTTLADQTRARSVANAKQEAEKLSVKLAFPLAVLLLPAFIILGLLPIFMSLFGSDLLPAFGAI